MSVYVPLHDWFLVVGVSAGNQSTVDLSSLLFLTVYGVLIYFVCALFSPSDLSYYEGYKEYFFSRRKMVLRGYGRDVCSRSMRRLHFPLRRAYTGVPSRPFHSVESLCNKTKEEPFQAAFAVLALLSEILFYFRQFFTVA